MIGVALLLVPFGTAQCCRLASEPLPAQYHNKQAAFARLKFKEFYEDADVVYETTVLRIEDHAGDRHTSNFLHIDYVWKTDGGRIDELIAGHGGGDCSIGFAVGHRQVVFAKRLGNLGEEKGSVSDPLYAMSDYFTFSMFRDERFQKQISHLLVHFSQLHSEPASHEFLSSLDH